MRGLRSAVGSLRRTGTTWVDVLTTLSCLLIGTLLFMAWLGCGVSGGAREAARRAQCKSQLKQLGLALHNNHDVEKVFPPGSTSKASWQTYLLPFVDQKPIHDFLDPRNGTAPVTNTTSISLFLCPSNIEASNLNGETTYLASSGRQLPRTAVDKLLRGVFRDESFDKDGRLKENTTEPNLYTYRGWTWRGNYFYFRDATDGTSSTIALGETTRGGIPWAPPFDPAAPSMGWVTGSDDGLHINAVVTPGRPPLRALFSSEHPGGAQFALVDGAVFFFSEKISSDVFAELVTIRGGEKEPEKLIDSLRKK